MLAPRKPIRFTVPKALAGFFRRPNPRPLGFSLRLNLWYTAFFIVGAFLLFSILLCNACAEGPIYPTVTP